MIVLLVLVTILACLLVDLVAERRGEGRPHATREQNGPGRQEVRHEIDVQLRA